MKQAKEILAPLKHNSFKFSQNNCHFLCSLRKDNQARKVLIMCENIIENFGHYTRNQMVIVRLIPLYYFACFLFCLISKTTQNCYGCKPAVLSRILLQCLVEILQNNESGIYRVGNSLGNESSLQRSRLVWIRVF